MDQKQKFLQETDLFLSDMTLSRSILKHKIKVAWPTCKWNSDQLSFVKVVTISMLWD